MEFETYIIEVIAQDISGKTVVDKFEITTKLTIMYVIGKCLEFGGIIVGIFGFWNYKDEMYEIIFKYKYQYRRVEQIEIN